MKIAITGNLNNNAYRLAKFLRMKGIDADCLITQNELYKNFNANPVYEDPCLEKQGFPIWIKNWHASSNLFKLRSQFKAGKQLDEYDIVHSFTYSSIYPYLKGKKYVVNPTSSDLEEFINRKLPLNYLFKKSLIHSNFTLFHNLHHFDIVEKLIPKGHYQYFPTIMNGTRFDKNYKMRNKNHLIMFSPTRINFPVKGMNKVIEAFHKLIENNRDPKFKLWLIEKGDDLEKAKKLIVHYEIEKYVEWFPTLKNDELIEIYYKSDVVLDQFELGAFGKVFLEAAFCGKPVIGYVNPNYIQKAYTDHIPFYNAYTTEEIFLAMNESISSNINQKGVKLKNWAWKNHHWESVINRIIDIYQTI